MCTALMEWRGFLPELYEEATAFGEHHFAAGLGSDELLGRLLRVLNESFANLGLVAERVTL